MKQLASNLTIGSLFLGLQILGLGQSVTLSIGSGSGTAGTTVSLPINLTSSGGAQTAGLNWTFVYSSSDITGVTVVAGPSATNASKSVTCNTNICLVAGFNNTAMADGTVATATFTVASNPSTTSIPIQITAVAAAPTDSNAPPISASGSSGTISLPAAPSVSVGVSPSGATLSASQSRQFTATVTGSGNTAVTWSMNPSVGSLSGGLYTAPSVINSAQSVTITATSVADSSKSASAVVQLAPIVSVGVSPVSASLSASQSTQFTATVTGNANTAVTWSMNPSLGSLSNGFYTAPSVINSAQSITIIATSVADPGKSAGATVQLIPTASVSVGVSPPTSILTASQSTQFAATVTGNANTSVTWSMNPSIGNLSNGFYTAPSVINSAQSVTITATSVADPTKSASATVQLMSTASVSVGISPLNTTLSASQITQFTATVTGNPNTSVTWSMTPSLGSLSNGFYTAPSVINTTQSVTITATSVADPTKSASATVQLTANGVSVSVGISPLSTTLSASQSTQFTAAVTGNANTAVTWSMTPSLGSLSNGFYTAPSAINATQSVTITATSVADPTKSASATVQLAANGASVGLSPLGATLTPSQSRQFIATVAGNPNAPVIWSMNPSVGSLSNGFYTAPSAINAPQSIIITAASVADPTKSASATVQLVPGGGTPSIGTVTITSPASQPAFTTMQSIDLAGTAPENTAQVVWTTDQGGQGQAAGTTAWAAKGVSLRKGYNRITVIALDGAGNQSIMAITVVVSPTIVTTSLPDGQLGKPYSSKLAAAGGIPPLTWSAASMPSGLALGPDGMITGTPAIDGDFTLNVTVQDSLKISAIATVKLRIDNGLIFVSAANLKPGPVAPGSMVTVFGGQLASVTQSATEQPLPTTLGDCTITITDANGVPHTAGLYYVSPNQVNFVIPADTAAGTAKITVTSADQIQTPGTLNIAAVSPGLFFLNSAGLAAADLTRVNASSTSYEEIAQLDATTNLFVAIPIDLGPDTDQVYLTLYGTGLRNRPSLDAVQVLVANVPARVDFVGASTTSAGLDLVRVLLPKELRGAGTATIIVTVNGISSNGVNVVIK